MEKLSLYRLLPLAVLLLFAAGTGCSPSEAEKNDDSTPEVVDQSPQVPDSVLLATGMEITTEAFKTLSGELKASLQSGGVDSALPYCTLMAYPLTDSISRKHNVDLRRTALRYRNPLNQPNEAESAQMEAFAAALQPGQPPKPVLKRNPGKPTVFYRPILLQEGCLRCHGTPGTDIADKDLQHIRSLYPEDKATGFAVGDLRGMWVVEFKND